MLSTQANWVRLRRAGWALSGLFMALGCSRHVELYEPSDAGVSVVEGPKPPAEIPSVADSGVTDSAFASCEERPSGDCVGANDFPCDFTRWVEASAETCTAQVDCLVQGWLGVSLGDDGCVERLEMTDPNPDFVACLAEEFKNASCVQCNAMHATRFLGTTAEPCAIPCINSSDCPGGYTCQSELCMRELG